MVIGLYLFLGGLAAGILLFSKGVMYKIKGLFGMIKEEDDDYDSIDIDETDDDDAAKH